MSNLKGFLTVKQAAAFLGVAPNTIRNWDRDRRIPVYRHPISNYRLIKKTDLEELLRQIEGSGTYPTGFRRRASSRKSANRPR
jgi:DNA (cytosine-5)-methyltransferase 1